ncbi:hypothetical protein BH688_15140 [Kushneria phosphatilytica]|nr:hypothetical protein BH688_15140 [Kushneria phosphatilytica]
MCLSSPTPTEKWQSAVSGLTYPVRLWIPPGPPPAQGWPVVVVLDADTLFATFVEAIQRTSRRPEATGIAPAAVVGIACAPDAHSTGRERYRDYTFDPPAEEYMPGANEHGGDALLTFIVDQLLPELRDHWPLDGARQSLFGHSLAGYFVLNVLARRPGIFHTHVAISPSIWWNEQALREHMTRLTRRDIRLFIGVGEWEEHLAPWQSRAPDRKQSLARRRARRMISRASHMAATVSHLPGEPCVAFHVFPDEDHASVVLVALQRALRFMLAPSR